VLILFLILELSIKERTYLVRVLEHNLIFRETPLLAVLVPLLVHLASSPSYSEESSSREEENIVVEIVVERFAYELEFLEMVEHIMVRVFAVHHIKYHSPFL